MYDVNVKVGLNVKLPVRVKLNVGVPVRVKLKVGVPVRVKLGVSVGLDVIEGRDDMVGLAVGRETDGRDGPGGPPPLFPPPAPPPPRFPPPFCAEATPTCIIGRNIPHSRRTNSHAFVREPVKELPLLSLSPSISFLCHFGILLSLAP